MWCIGNIRVFILICLIFAAAIMSCKKQPSTVKKSPTNSFQIGSMLQSPNIDDRMMAHGYLMQNPVENIVHFHLLLRDYCDRSQTAELSHAAIIGALIAADCPDFWHSVNIINYNSSDYNPAVVKELCLLANSKSKLDFLREARLSIKEGRLGGEFGDLMKCFLVDYERAIDRK